MVTDLLTRIKNAQAVKHERVKLPYSKMNETVAHLLLKHKYVAGVVKKGRMPKRMLEVELKYENGSGVIRGIKFVSKPSRRIYAGYRDLKSVKQGYGMLMISTPEGLMSGSEARKKKLGGELLFEIW
ncbi:30S ribosomal protein S8 [Candidatus Wolfebacteria bacterium RIFCSPLOWO2_01_FULL_45_19]|uniref:Small ribosomal subunit protein uS8 n=1 Tax=Candidatus Wolfebacteria bacterium RIFCSPLOWO2_01_FULL_45_19 TaxID=1802557 RepID=A0A1F8DT23_9BACT|nr:MAG: 30S ribosomal protein S8 [Parcubacteria group bacterium GW2011_GWB1_45_9]OGM91612.1 MAG: 30S ribosomal protein S8 [Candidatus Wolfebacteria bacterium RIFCSPLOWO2_01_FULL_45_19]